jgi:hypothetical protein
MSVGISSSFISEHPWYCDHILISAKYLATAFLNKALVALISESEYLKEQYALWDQLINLHYLLKYFKATEMNHISMELFKF